MGVHRERLAASQLPESGDLRRQGASHANLLQSASRLVYIVQFLNLRNLRPVTFSEIREAAKAWLRNREHERVRTANRCAIYGFTRLARRFSSFMDI
jgi:hypothetical protein